MVTSQLTGQIVNFDKEPYMMYQNEEIGTTGEYLSTLEKLLVRWQLSSTSLATSCELTYEDGISSKTVQATYDTDDIWEVSLDLDVDLNPDTKYTYEVILYNNGVPISETKDGTFLTPPLATETSVTYYGYGDTRGDDNSPQPPTPPPAHNDVCNAILNEFSSSNDPGSQTFLLHTGDWNNISTDPGWDLDYFWEGYNEADELRANMPIMGAIGNHEGSGGSYYKYWPYKYDEPFCYSFDYGPVHICVVKVQHENYPHNIIPENIVNWVSDDLSSTEKEWKVMMLHVPIYSSGNHPNHPDALLKLRPLCLTNGVQTVLNGHNHYYSHWLVDGIHYLTLGGGGAKLYDDFDEDIGEVEVDDIDHFGKFIVNGDNMTVNIIQPNIVNHFEDFVVPKYYNININNGENLTWEDNISYIGNITVKSGGILTVECELNFIEDGNIIVERGGKLVIDGGLISGMDDNLWQGIQVHGNAALDQTYSNQGVVEIINGGTIENAVCGIETIKYNDIEYSLPNYSYTGGIVAINDGVFKNNKTAIKFWRYTHDNSISLIGNCQFIADDNIITGTDPDYFVKLNEIDGVRVIASSFNDSRSGLQAHELITGINCYDAYINVFQGCEFTDLNYGIYATASTTATNIDIKDSEFIDNYRGIYIGGMTSPRVTSNTFELKYSYNLLSDGYGLYLDESTDYWVEDNVFEKSSSITKPDPLGMGIIVNESGEDPNEIYLNVFNDVENAINVQGNNRDGTNGDIGLVIKCNDYNNTDADETIIWPPGRITSKAGIAGEQGEGTLDIEDMAGNIFHVPPIVDGDYDDLHNQANDFDYYYSTNTDDDDVEPMDATWSTVDKYPKPTTLEWSHVTACESTIHTGGGGTGDDREKMSAAQSGIEITEAILTALVDGGDTEGLNTEVETSTPPETVVVYNELMSESPNLSETVVESTIEKENVMPNAMVRDVMVANPHTAKSHVLMDKLDERLDPMPEYMKAQILAGKSIQTLKQELEAQLAGYQMRKAKAMNSIVRYYKNELEPQNAYDSLLALYIADNTIKSTYRLAWLYLENGDYQLGSGVISNIPSQFSLTDEEQLVYDGMDDIYSILSGLYQNGNTLEDLSENQVSELHSLALGEVLTTRAYARNILMAVDELEYEEPVLHVDLSKSQQLMEDYNKLMSAKAPQMLSVYPNPSTGYVILEYNHGN